MLLKRSVFKLHLQVLLFIFNLLAVKVASEKVTAAIKKVQQNAGTPAHAQAIKELQGAQSELISAIGLLRGDTPVDSSKKEHESVASLKEVAVHIEPGSEVAFKTC